MKLAIIGSREFTDLNKAKNAFKRYCCEFNEAIHDGVYDGYLSFYDTIVSGGALGADSIAREIAKLWNLKLTEFLPDWEKYGKRAGFIRNEDIIKNSEKILAFGNGSSHGTANSLSIAKRLKKDTIIIYF